MGNAHDRMQSGKAVEYVACAVWAQPAKKLTLETAWEKYTKR